MNVTLYDPAMCPHEWVLPGVLMPEGYWKPTGPITCRWCGAWQHVQMTTTIIGGPITGTTNHWEPRPQTGQDPPPEGV